MNEKPFYRFEIKSKRTGKKIRHFINANGHGFYGYATPSMNDQRMKDIAFGIVYGLMNDKEIYVEVYKLNEQGNYDIIHTQF
jgi:hypothetical protein